VSLEEIWATNSHSQRGRDRPTDRGISRSGRELEKVATWIWRDRGYLMWYYRTVSWSQSKTKSTPFDT
jgi:hypothetical protein